jgi:hypothetical protein
LFELKRLALDAVRWSAGAKIREGGVEVGHGLRKF